MHNSITVCIAICQSLTSGQDPGSQYIQWKWKRGLIGRQEGRGRTAASSGGKLRVTGSHQSCLASILNKAAEVGDGDEGLSIGGRVEKGEILEVKLQANKDSKTDKWELAINEAREESIGVFTGGSMSEEGRVGGGWHVEGLAGSKEGLGKLATVWDGEVVGMRGGIQMVPEDQKILLLSDSQAAIAAVRKAGRTGRARTGELKEVVEEVRKRQKNLGPDAVRFAWVKAHVGTRGNEKADQMAKSGAELGDEDQGMNKVITGGGVEAGMEEKKSGRKESEGDGDGKSGEMEPQGSSQLCPLSHRKRQPTSLATRFGH